MGASLKNFVWSTLSKAREWSKGKYCGIYHFDSKAAVVDYINGGYPEVVKKYITSVTRIVRYQLGMGKRCCAVGKGLPRIEMATALHANLHSDLDGSMCPRIPESGDEPIPLIDPADTGIFVRALLQVPAGKHLLAANASHQRLSCTPRITPSHVMTIRP